MYATSRLLRRADEIEKRSRGAFFASELCQPRRRSKDSPLCRAHDPEKRPPVFGQDHARIKGSGAPKGASHPLAALHSFCLPPCGGGLGGGRQRIQRDALAFRRFAAALVAATERCNSAQAALHAPGRARALPVPSNALKRCTPRPGRHAGGDDAQAARERGYKPRPQEPHSPHPTAVTGRRP